MVCDICGNIATDQHHKFSQTKNNKKLYKDYIHNELNIMYLCNGCHLNKSIMKWDELTFCKEFKIKPRSKELLQKIKDKKIEKFWIND